MDLNYPCSCWQLAHFNGVKSPTKCAGCGRPRPDLFKREQLNVEVGVKFVLVHRQLATGGPRVFTMSNARELQFATILAPRNSAACMNTAPRLGRRSAAICIRRAMAIDVDVNCRGQAGCRRLSKLELRIRASAAAEL